MAIASASNSVIYSGNGTTSAFSVPFRWFKDSDIVVTRAVVATGITTTLVQGTGYSLVGTNLPAGGTLTLLYGNLATGETLTIERRTTALQGLSLRSQGAFDSASLENELDRLTMAVQDAQSEVDGFQDYVDAQVAAVQAGATEFADVRSVKDLAYGAKGDGSTDDTAAIQSAINAAFAAGGGIVWFPVGTYIVSANLTHKAKVILQGQGRGTQIKVKASTGDTVNIMIDMVQSDFAEVRDLYLNGNNTNRGVLALGNSAVAIRGSSHCRVKNVYAYDFGKTAVASGGIVMWVQSYEPLTVRSPAPGVSLPAQYNIIEDCVFDDSLKKSNFIIRCQSDFDIDQPASDYTAPCANNTFRNCISFGGSFVSNQFAGPACLSNTFDHCHVRNWSTNEAFLVDKGASYNTVVGCTVKDFVTPGALASLSGPTAYRCQGYGIFSNTNVWPSIANVFSGNTASGWGPATGDSSGMECHQDWNTQITGNTFEMASTSAELNGIIFAEASQGVSVVGNTIRGGKNGIVNYGNNMHMDLENWNFRDNHIDCTNNGINLGAADAACKFKHITIQNNTIVGAQNCAIGLDSDSLGTKIEDCVVEGNKVRDCLVGIRFTGVRLFVANNYITESSATGLFAQTVTDSVVRGNKVRITSGFATGGFDTDFLTSNTLVDNEFDYVNTDDRMGRRPHWGFSIPMGVHFEPYDSLVQQNPGNAQLEWLCHTPGTTCDTQWAALTAYTQGDQVFNGIRVYQCITAGTSAASGGPTGTSANITDGTAHWEFVEPRAIFKLTKGDRDVINVMNYGAIGDGVADDTLAFTNAITDLSASFARKLLIPSGVYRCNIVNITSGTEISGIARSTVELRPADKTLPVIRLGNGVTQFNSFKVSNLTIASDGTGATSDGLDMYGVADVEVDNVTFNGFGRDNIIIRSSATAACNEIHLNNFTSVAAHGRCLKVLYGASFVIGVNLSNFYMRANGSTSAYSIYTDATIHAVNGRIVVPNDLQGNVYISNQGGDITARLWCAGVLVYSENSSTDVAFQFDTSARGSFVERIAGAYDIGAYGKWLADASTEYLGGNKLGMYQSATPGTAADKGQPGMWSVDGSYVYVCTAANTWKRAAIAAW